MTRGNTPKVFGIGFQKTATTSLASALRILGYRVTGPNGKGDPEIAGKARALAFSLIDRYDAFQDNPWPLLYRELDQACPGSKFILTVRPTAAWLNSVVKHFGAASSPMRVWIYGEGSPLGHEAVYAERYERHNAEVLAYFKDRPEDLLVFRITEGDGWRELCAFLGQEIPDVAFPHANSAGERQARKRRRSLVGRIGRKITKLMGRRDV